MKSDDACGHFCITHIRTKYGMAISTIPNVTSRIVLDTKYGKIIKVRPEINGTTFFCLLPYTKKPSPIEPKTKPQRRDDASNTALKPPNDEVIGWTQTRPTRRERNIARRARDARALPHHGPLHWMVRSHIAYLQPSSRSKCTFASHSTANTKDPTLSPSIMTIIWRTRKSHCRSARYAETAAIR